MWILDRQRYWAFLKAYLICFFSLVGLYVVIHAFTNIDEFTKVADGTADLFGRMGWYYLIHFTEFYDRLCGVITMMAAIFTVTWMQRNNELLAMLAAGISTRRVIRPVIVSALVVNALAVANQEWIIPSIGASQLQRDPADDIKRPVTIFGRYDVNGILIHGKDADRRTQTIRPFNATLPIGLFGTSHEIEAREARHIPEEAARCPYRRGWLLWGASIKPSDALLDELQGESERLLVRLSPEELARFPAPQGQQAALNGAAYFLHTNITFDAITRKRSWYQFASSCELIRGLSDPANDAERMEMLVFLHGRILRPALSLTLLFLSLPLVLGGDNRNTFVNLGLSLATSAVFYAALFMTQFLGNNAVITPELAAWAPLIGFGTLATARWDKIRT